MTLRLSRDEVREVDRIAIEELCLPGVVLMENAGRGAARRILAALAEGRLRATRAPRVLVLCGAGNNGGDGYVVARHLSEAGLACTLGELAPPERLSPDAAVFRRVTRALGLAHLALADDAAWAAARPDLERAGLVVDAVLGTGFRGALRTPLCAQLERAGALARARGLPVVALDVPSGLDADSGVPADGALRADLTLTFVAEKRGFAAPGAQEWTGAVEVVPIGAPHVALERVLAARRAP